MEELGILTNESAIRIENNANNQFVIPSDERNKICEEANKMIEEVFSLDLSSAQNRLALIEKIDGLGEDIIKKSSTACSLLKVRIKDLSKLNDKEDSQTIIINNISELNAEMKRLDPSRINFNEKGILGGISRKIKKYFEQYETADGVIKNIIQVMEKSKKRLENDNKTLEIKQVDLRNTTIELAKMLEYVEFLSAAISERIELAKQEGLDPELIRFIESQILFVVLQKQEDFSKQMVVNQNGYIAIEIIKRNNFDLLRSIRRASTTTISALETGVIVASALYDQKIVLKQIDALNQATDNMIRGTSELLRTQGVEIQRQSVNMGPSIETLQEAFNNTFEALNEIEKLRLEAIPIMKERIGKFIELTTKGEAEIKKIEATMK